MRTFLIALAVVSSWCSAIAILSPNGGEYLAAGTPCVVTWEPINDSGQVRVSFSADNGNSWLPLATVANTGSYAWTLPAEPSELCLIMIDDLADPGNVWDISDGVFVVYACTRTITGDINGDCYVDLQDVAAVASNWLVCSNPYDLNCPCAAPFADCDGWAGNGCEVNLSTDAMNCNICGNACSFPHAYAECINSECVLTLCQPGYFDCDGDPANGCEGVLTDLYEANNTFATARNLGTIPEASAAVTLTAQLVPSGDEDWYRIYAQEGSHTCFPGTDQDYVIQVRLTPPQGVSCVDYDLYLYDDGGTELARSYLGGCQAETINYIWDGQCGTDDSRYFRIRVAGYGGAWNCVSYALQMDMYPY